MEQSQTVTHRRRRTQREITALLAEFRLSNLSVAEFCQARQIPRQTFHQWISRNKKKELKAVVSPAFAPVEVMHSRSSVLFAEVGGVKIYQPVSALFLKQLMK